MHMFIAVRRPLDGITCILLRNDNTIFYIECISDTLLTIWRDKLCLFDNPGFILPTFNSQITTWHCGVHINTYNL